MYEWCLNGVWMICGWSSNDVWMWVECVYPCLIIVEWVLMICACLLKSFGIWWVSIFVSVFDHFNCLAVDLFLTFNFHLVSEGSESPPVTVYNKCSLQHFWLAYATACKLYTGLELFSCLVLRCSRLLVSRPSFGPWHCMLSWFNVGLGSASVFMSLFRAGKVRRAKYRVRILLLGQHALGRQAETYSLVSSPVPLLRRFLCRPKVGCAILWLSQVGFLCH